MTTEPAATEEPAVVDRLEVRASINLTGLRAGQKAVVDPRSPYIAMCIREGYLVPTEAAA